MILPTSSRSSDLTGEQGTDSNVKVVVRIRPENEREVAQQHTVVVHAVNEHVLAFDPADDHCSNAGSHMGRKFNRWDITKKRNKDLSFAFDHVFGPTANNIDLYEHTTKTVLDGLLNGYNCSVFAYGATGAGKTYTMLGTSKQPGITFLMLMDLYKRIDALKEDKLCNIAVSYLEVYNEQIRDLLMNSGSLPIREDPKSGAVISGLTLHQPKNAEELLQMLHHGNQNRSQHPTDANAESSRSHAVFQVFVKQCDRTANLVTNVRVAKLCLIDLAGSERATVTSNKGTRFREGANINQSLLALGNVINALADRKSKVHIPYRNSKLTRLLKDSLGGNCRTVMIATVSPSSGSYEDTYNTLKYADRAKNIKANLKRNVLSVKSHFSRYGKIVEDLRLEVQGLKEKLQQCESGALVPGCHVQPDEEVMRLQEELHNIFMSRSSLRKEILEYESAQRGMEWKILCKRKHLARIGGCFLEQESGASEKKRVCEGIEMMWSRIASVHRRKEASLHRFEENENCLKRLKSEMVLAGNSDDGKMPELLEISLHARHLEVEVGDLRRHNKHLKTVVQAQERENQTNDRLVLEVLCTMKKFFFVMKGNNLLTSDLKDDCLRIQKLVQGRKEVMWADQAEPHTDPEVEENKKILDSIISFPMLKKLNITPTLSNSVKHRRESLTPLLNSTRSLMEMAEDEKQMIESPENEVRHKTHQLTPCIARGSKRWCIGSFNDSLLKSALGSSLAASEESPGPLNRSAERLKSLPQLPEASVEKPPGVCESSLSRTFLCPSHEKPVGKINENCDEAVKGNLVRAIHLNSEESPKSGLSFADVVKSSFRSPLLTINNHLSPPTQPVTPQAAPSTRDLASKPIFISGSTVTKSQVTLPRTKPSEHFQTASNFSLKSIHKLRPQTIDGNVTSGSKNSSKLNNKTGYLRMTHAASVRSHDTVRSKFQKPLLKTDKNSFCRQQKTKVHFQSKSASNLNKVVRLL